MQNDDIDKAVDFLLPAEFVQGISKAFMLWAIGEIRESLHCDCQDFFISSWNSLHEEDWIISQEDPINIHNEKIRELWERELQKMISIYIDSLQKERKAC